MRNANAYRLFRYSSENDSDFATLFLGLSISENINSESFYLCNPDRENGIIHIRNEYAYEVISKRKKPVIREKNK